MTVTLNQDIFESLLMNMLCENHEKRKATTEWIRKKEKELLPQIIKATTSPDSNIRWYAVDFLGSMKNLEATSAVLDRVLRDDDVHVRWRSIWAINNLDDGNVVSYLLEVLNGDDDKIAWNAAVALSVFGRHEAIPILLKGLEKYENFQLWEAVNALGTIHNDETIKALTLIIQKDDIVIRKEAVLSLGRIGDNCANTVLLKVLNSEPEPEVRWRAAMAIGRIGDPSVIPQLLLSLENEKNQIVRENIQESITLLRY